jgi:hypothetical protein
VAKVKSNQFQWRIKDAQQRDGVAGNVVEMHDRAQIDPPVQEIVLPANTNTTADWVEWIDKRIDEKLKDAVEAMGGEVGKLQMMSMPILSARSTNAIARFRRYATR